MLSKAEIKRLKSEFGDSNSAFTELLRQEEEDIIRMGYFWVLLGILLLVVFGTIGYLISIGWFS